jgi:hypothetical protein
LDTRAWPKIVILPFRSQGAAIMMGGTWERGGATDALRRAFS